MGENQKIQKWYLHVDLDAFFASVEQLDHPEYRGKPVIVGGKPEDRRGVVSTASYEARKFGVHSAMPTFQAYRLCPHGIFVHGRMERYAELSYQIMNILKDFSPDVEQMSIDEAFLDITGTEKLFGLPEETAYKIKNRVKTETGLTISVGLAPTKYLAKLASDYKKPDGFFCIKPGEETDFMLSLPLKKVWGIGSKTQEILKKSGIKTTKDIYEKDIDLLTFMFGKNTASFLYNAVRGQEFESFNRETKSHSISSETTFPYDINDIYLLETKILDLAHGVYFRLLQENSFSRTAFLKIRYDDFSTFTIQETEENNICTLDSFYEILKRLFEKKYENGRGIRLLGVGFENIEKEDKPEQQSLFENNDRKKNQIEKAILKIQKKHPEIEIKKARTLKAVTIFILTSLFCIFNSQKLNAETLNETDSSGTAAITSETLSEPEKKEDSLSFYELEIDNKNSVDFIFSGYWSQKLESGLNLNFTNSSFSSASVTSPVFTQEVDLSAIIKLNNLWYFESDFADEFSKNTFTIGYSDNQLQVKLSNRNITFPQNYSASTFGFGLNGGNNEAPGISAHFEKNNLSPFSADFLLRYEMTESCNATFYGYNQVTDYNFEISDFTYGKQFIFPEEFDLSEIKDIYVEDSSGTYKDSFSRKYKKIDSSDYVILKNSRKLIFSTNAKTYKKDNKIPAILITFNNIEAKTFISLCGNYEDSSSFLGEIQSYFEDTKLSEYSYNLENTISDISAVCIQNNTGFSPFLCQNIYDLGIISDADVFVDSKSTDLQNGNYSAEIIENDYGDDFFNSKHLYAEVYKENRFPFAQNNPEIYFNLSSTSDLEITARTYSEISSFNIGTDAISGTVTVYVNGIIDSAAVFDSETGNVSLSHSVNDTDKIYITWQEESDSYNTGAAAFGAGFYYKPADNFSADFSLTARWPVDFYASYSTADNSLSGFTALSGGINYEKNNLKIAEKAAISLENPDSTGNLLAVTTENENETFYLTSSSGYKTLAVPVLNLETQTIYLEEEYDCTIENYNGITDSQIAGYKIPLEWNFSSLSEKNWASVDIKLNSESLLKNSSQLEIGLKPDFSSTPENDDYKVYVQLGIKAESNFSGEDSSSIPTWLISETSDLCPSSLDITKNQWQTVKINLQEKDRAKLVSSSDLRLIVVNNSSNNSGSGIIYAGPFEPLIQSFFVEVDENILVNTTAVAAESPSYKDLNLEENYSTDLNWIITDKTKITEDNSKITVSTYFDDADFSNYEQINFDFKINSVKEECSLSKDEEEDFELLLSRTEDDSQTEALKLVIKDFSKLNCLDDSFHTLKVDLLENTVFLDDVTLETENYDLFINKNVIPDKETLVFDTLENGSLLTSGDFYIDNLYYSESSYQISAQNKIKTEYKKDGDILKINNFSLLKNGSFNIESNQKVSTSTKNFKDNFEGLITASGNGEINIAGIETSALINTKFSDSDSNEFLQSAGHSAKTEKNLFKIINFEETYRFNKADNQLTKKNSLSFDFNQIKFPLKLSSEFNSQTSKYLKKQNTSFKVDFTVPLKDFSINFDSVLSANQKIKETYESEDYFSDWLNITKLNFSTGKENAALRQITFDNKLGFKFPFASLNPEIEYKMESDYKNSSSVTFSDNSYLIFELPFTIGSNTFSFENSRETDEKQICSYGGNFISDGQKYISELKNSNILFAAIPFYELFDSSLCSKLNNSENYENSLYSTKYNFSWKRKMFNSSVDFFIPSSSSIVFSRNIDYSTDYSDYYQLKTVISNSCVNIFGKQSKFHLFNFYETDEYISNLTGITKIPRQNPENTTFTVSSYIQSVFYLKNDSNLKEGLTYTIDTDKNWNFNSTSIISYKLKNTPLSLLIGFASKNKVSTMTIKEKDTLILDFSDSSSIFKQIYSLEHKDEVKFLKYYTIGLGTGFSFTATEKSTDVLGLNLTISGKMDF